MEHVHLCLTDLIDQDLSAYEYYHSLPPKTRALLKEREIRTLEELQECVVRLNASNLYN